MLFNFSALLWGRGEVGCLLPGGSQSVVSEKLRVPKTLSGFLRPNHFQNNTKMSLVLNNGV